MFEHKEEIGSGRLSDAELAEMRAMLFVWEKVPSSFVLFMAELSKVATDEMKDSGEWQIIAAAPESMAKLLGEVERLQREIAVLKATRTLLTSGGPFTGTHPPFVEASDD